MRSLYGPRQTNHQFNQSRDFNDTNQNNVNFTTQENLNVCSPTKRQCFGGLSLIENYVPQIGRINPVYNGQCDKQQPVICPKWISRLPLTGKSNPQYRKENGASDIMYVIKRVVQGPSRDSLTQKKFPQTGTKHRPPDWTQYLGLVKRLTTAQ